MGLIHFNFYLHNMLSTKLTDFVEYVQHYTTSNIDLIFLAYKRDVKMRDKAAVKALWDTLRQVY